MKKVSGIYLAILLLVGAMIGFIPNIIGGGFIKGWYFIFIVFAGIAYGIIFMLVKDLIWWISVKKLTADFDRHNFKPTSTFNGASGNFYIDVSSGRLGAITKLNPFKLQLVDATSAQNLTVDDGTKLSPFGGTRLVRFCFEIDGIKWKIPTFSASGQTYSMKSSEVLEALSKADMQIAMINEAKAVAQSRMQGANIHGAN